MKTPFSGPGLTGQESADDYDPWNHVMTPAQWQAIAAAPEKTPVVVAAWVHEGPVLGWSWKQAVAQLYSEGWELCETGPHACDGDLSFTPTHFVNLPEPHPHP